jgi:lipoyl(octanoyl) transferase
MIDLSLFENPCENIFVLKKWDWDYLLAQDFQLKCVDYVQQNPHVTLLIICSHPHCFTIGRGLQKVKETSKIELVDFDESLPLRFPLHHIKRGGGLTFHYPGQVVFYPIMNLTSHKLAVYDVMLKIMEITKELLEKQFFLESLTIKRDLLGLWFEDQNRLYKIASIGLAVTRFNTYHGLALNLFNDKQMFQALSSLHPCGLPGILYNDIERLTSKQISQIERERFVDEFLKMFLLYLNPILENHWMTDKQRSSSLIIDSIS